MTQIYLWIIKKHYFSLMIPGLQLKKYHTIYFGTLRYHKTTQIPVYCYLHYYLWSLHWQYVCPGILCPQIPLTIFKVINLKLPHKLTKKLLCKIWRHWYSLLNIMGLFFMLKSRIDNLKNKAMIYYLLLISQMWHQLRLESSTFCAWRK